MEFWEVIKRRRRIRKFQNKEVIDSDIKKILEAGILAPSEGNFQPWYFVVVKNKDLKLKLQEAAFFKNKLVKLR